MSSDKGILTWIYSKIFMVGLLVGVLTVIYFVWYSFTPLLAFVMSGGDTDYQATISRLDEQISDIQEERNRVESEIQENPYDKQTALLAPYALRLQAKERELRNRLLALDKPSAQKYLLMFWYAFLENIFSLIGITLLVLIGPDLWFSLRRRRQMKNAFSNTPVDKHDNFWFFQGRIGKSRYFPAFLKICIIFIVLSAISYYFSSSENGILMLLISLMPILMTGLIILLITLAVKRFHDLGKTGKWAWLLLVPFYNIYLGLMLFLKNGEENANQYGENPSQYEGIF